jgi:hypothetical protein
MVIVKLSGTHLKPPKVKIQKENIVQSKQLRCQRVEKVQYVMGSPNRIPYKNRIVVTNSKIRFYSHGIKGRKPLWGPWAKPLVGSKGEALVCSADCCKVI